MNLDSILKEGNLSDIEWLDESTTFNPSNMDLSSEEQMKLQWDRDLKPENKEKLVKRKVNELLNSGAFGRDVISSVRKVFAKQNVPSGIKKYVRARSGAVGTVLVDCSVFDDNKDYLKTKKASQYKSFHQYAINCNCDHKVTSSLQENNISGLGDIDGFMNTEMVEVEGVKVCAKTGLPVLSKMSKYSSKDATDVLAKLVRLDYITVDKEKELLLNNTPLVAVKKAFNMIVDNAIAEEEAKYAGKIDNTEFAVKESSIVAEVEKEVATTEVSGIQEKDLTVGLEDAMKTPKISGIKENGLVAELAMKAKKNVDVKISKKESGLDTKQSKLNGSVDVKISKKESSLDALKPEEANGNLDVKISKKSKKLDFEKLADLDNEMLNINANPADNKVDLEDAFESVDIDNEEYIDEDWFNKEEMDTTAKEKENFEYLDVDESSEFNF